VLPQKRQIGGFDNVYVPSRKGDLSHQSHLRQVFSYIGITASGLEISASKSIYCTIYCDWFSKRRWPYLA
jgi:hypothetical protein